MCSGITSCKGQQTFGTQYLQFEKSILLPNVKGRIDHLAMNEKDKIIYVAALGNNSLEIVDLQKGKVIHTIKGLDEPQGVAYISPTDEIFVANGGNGACYFYNVHTFKKTDSVQLSSDADDAFYDPVSNKIYVGYGSGGIAVIDAVTHRLISRINLPAHPERFQLDKPSGKIYANLPDAHTIGVIDLNQMKLMKEWKTNHLHANFPMALDTLHHRLFIGYRQPATLAVLDSRTGKVISTMPMTGDADDMYFDEAAQRIYVSGGSGYINIFQQKDADTYHKIADIPTQRGARTSLLVPRLHLFLVAERAEGNREAQLLIYSTANSR
ncbi:MAG: YncE family protein [Chitinophagaceae bacterium]|nr:MAG: YncE family protein [Chitinophagaceae bacterium]